METYYVEIYESLVAYGSYERKYNYVVSKFTTQLRQPALDMTLFRVMARDEKDAVSRVMLGEGQRAPWR